MKQEVLINNRTGALKSMASSFMLAVYFAITNDDVFWYVVLLIMSMLAIYFYFKDKNKTLLICSFDEIFLFFPTIGRQLRLVDILEVEIYKSKFTYFYIIKIYSNAYEHDILKLKVPTKLGVVAMLKLFKSINIDDGLIKTKI
ncbi:MAG: hypothetical protein GY787_04130 [Alteromonadales bacterium]|nr:hypothetical protein [Alteromonadales bacterium]